MPIDQHGRPGPETEGQEAAGPRETGGAANGGESAEAPGAQGGRTAELEAEVARLKDQLLRSLAETENLRKRHAREREDVQKFAVQQFAKDIVSAADNLRRALAAAPADKAGLPDSVKGLVDGVAMVEREMISIFERHGLKRIEPLGERFDPAFHQPMFEMDASEQHQPGTVGQVLQAGYVLHGRCLRPALVAVVKAAGRASGSIDTTA